MKYSYYIVNIQPWNNSQYTVGIYAKDRDSAIREARKQHKESLQNLDTSLTQQSKVKS